MKFRINKVFNNRSFSLDGAGMEAIRLSNLEEHELMIVAIKKAAQEILDHTALIKELTGRIEELEAKAESASDELECINRVLDAT
tara:strand:+ start:161 stop:415 length:255 start_codon:yes stop_codon:yes gene_type:complete